VNLAHNNPRPGALSWIVIAAGFAVVPHALRLPVWITIVFAALLAWCYAAIHRGWYRPGLVVRTALALLLAAAVFREYGTLLGRDPGTAMLLLLTGLKFIESRGLRDYMVTVFLLYLIVATDFLYSQSLVQGAYMVASAALCTQALVQLNLRHPRPWRADFRLVAGLLLKAAPLMIVMYVLFPRIQGGLWGLPPDAFGASTGLSEELRPGSINRLSQSDEPAFRVEFEGAHPPPQQLYWRAFVLWNSDGHNWHIGTRSRANKGPSQKSGMVYRYTVTLEPTNKRWLVALDRPLSVPANAHRLGDYLLRATSPISKRLRYTMASQIQHRRAPLSAGERRAGLQLPPNTTVRVRELARRWRREAGSDGGVIKKALAYFHNQGFVYTLTPPLLGENPVDQFLFDSREGYCEHYATSFVILMRAAGIPARVVAGYQGGEYNETGNYYLVRQSDAHAWAEAWLPNGGWVRVDPTAAVAPERIELGMDAIRRLRSEGLPLGQLSGDALTRAIRSTLVQRLWASTRMYWDMVNLQWYRWVSDYGEDQQDQLLRTIGMLTPTWLGKLAGMISAVVLLALAMLWLMGRRRVRDPVLAIYERYCRKLARLGLVRRRWEGASDYADRVVKQRPELTASVRAITDLYIRLRYGGGGGADQLRELRRQVRGLRVHPWWGPLRGH
jgi:transglutaminase-like putative cysteine protease